MGLLDRKGITRNKKTIHSDKLNDVMIENICVEDINYSGDINYHVARYMIDEYLPKVIGKELSLVDFETIHDSAQDNLNDQISNNGIIYEWIAEDILSGIKLESLIQINEIEMQNPAQGLDLILYDPRDKKIYLFEVKSTESSLTLNAHLNVLKNSLESLYMKKSKTNLKLSKAHSAVENKIINDYDKELMINSIRFIRKNRRSIYNLLNSEHIKINSIIIGRRTEKFTLININDDEFLLEVKNKLSEFINDFDNYCEQKDASNVGILKDKKILFHFMNIQFDNSISINKIYEYLIRIIEDEKYEKSK